jgi:hypothetical protein
MQRKKNITLLVVLGSVLILTIVTFLLDRPPSSLDVDRDIFSMPNPVNVNKVVLKSSTSEVTLKFENGRWFVNESYEADPQRISVLFAILKQVKVRRKAAKNQKASLDSLYQSKGIEVTFYEDETIAKQFTVAGNQSQSLTYVGDGNSGDKYLVEIPGYRSYLAGLFELDESGWRNPLVFNLNWVNLQAVSVHYSGNEDNNFDIIFDDRNYTIKGLRQVDSLRLTDFLDDVSLLYVNDYLIDNEIDNYKEMLSEPRVTISIHDIGNNDYFITVFDKVEKGNYLIKIDSLDYALMEENLVKKVMKPKSYFKADYRDQ